MGRRLLSLLVVAATILLPLAPSGRVLCIGSDGHVQVEDEGSLCCAYPGVVTVRSDASGAVPTDGGIRVPAIQDDCGSCVDIRMVRSGEMALDRRVPRDVPVSFAVLVPAPPLHARIREFARADRIALSSRALSPLMTRLSTVVRLV